MNMCPFYYLQFQQKASSSSVATSFKDFQNHAKQELQRQTPAAKGPKVVPQGPTVTLQFRYPNGEKKQLTLPKASQIQVICLCVCYESVFIMC